MLALAVKIDLNKIVVKKISCLFLSVAYLEYMVPGAAESLQCKVKSMSGNKPTSF